MDTATLQRTEVDGRPIAYREVGEGPGVLLLHGWPTSSFLWRNVMGPIATHHRVVAPDLPGFGGSDKPTGVRYDSAFFDSFLDGFCTAVGLGPVGLAVHDLGGPIGLHWAAERPGRVRALALLNTLVYPELGPEVVEFARTLLDPLRCHTLTSPEALAVIVREGMADPARVTAEIVAAVTAPFGSAADRRALARAGCGLRRPGLARIAEWLPTVTMPVRIVYGARDRVLPDVAPTMARVAEDVPHAEVTVLDGGGHFVTEDDPDTVATLLASFFAAALTG